MSTSYYRLAYPLTRLNEIPDGGDGVRRIQGWSHDRLVFMATIMDDYLFKNIVISLTQYEEDSECPLRTHWGGKERGAVVTVNDPHLPDDATVISNYGEILTVGQVKARDGAHRKDGVPTELFGYEN